jgi:hypothetical protein
MAAPPDYKPLSRRPPFTGLSSANATAQDYAGATEALNVNFSDSIDTNSAVISRRPGWRKVAEFSETFQDFAPYEEQGLFYPTYDYALSRNTGAYGAHLFGSGGVFTWAPVQYSYDNPDRHSVNIALREDGYLSLTVDDNASVTIQTFDALQTALHSYGLVYNTLRGRTSPFDYTYLDMLPALSVSTVEPLMSSEATISIVARYLSPVVSPLIDRNYATYTQKPTFPGALFKVPVTGSMCVVKYPTTSVASPSSLGTLITDGHILESPVLGSSVGTVVASGGPGANYYNFASQVHYIEHVDYESTTLSVQPSNSEYYGPLSTRKALSLSAGGTFTVPLTQSGFGSLVGGFNIEAATASEIRQRLSYSYTGKSAPGAGRYGKTLNQYVNSTAESVQYPIYVGGGAGDLCSTTVTFGLTGVSGIGINARVVIWRTKAQTSAAAASTAVLYKMYEGYVPYGGSVINSTADAALTEVYLPRATEPEIAGGWLGTATAACSHQTRVVIGMASGQLIYSLPDEPLNFAPSTNSFQLDYRIKALVSDADAMYAFTDGGIYAITGALGTLDCTVQIISPLTLPSGAGSEQQSVATTGAGGTMFLASDGLAYIIAFGKVAPVPNFRLPPVRARNTPTWGKTGSQESDVEPANKVSRLRTAYIASTSSFVIGLVGSRELHLLDSSLRWSKYSLPHALLDLQSMKGKLVVLLRSDSGSALWELSGNFETDGGTEFTFRYASQWEDLQDPRTEKTFARLHVDLAEGASQNTDLTISTEYDYLQGKPGTTNAYPLRDSQGWGNRAWGAFGWGDKNQTHISLPLTNEKHRSMRVIFESTQNLAISGWSIEAIPTGAHSK